MTILEEIAIKEKRLREIMDQRGLEAILIKRQANFTWFTGGHYNMVLVADAFGMNSILITRGGERFLVSNQVEIPRMEEEEGLPELGFKTLGFPWNEDLEAATVAKVVPDQSRIGCDAALRGNDYRDVSGEIQRARYSLTPNEIERYDFLGRRLSTAVEKTILGLRPGDSEGEAAGRIARELWRDRIDVVNFMIAADDRPYRFRHPIVVNRLIKKYVMVCCNGRYKGLITTITRFGHFGKIDPGLHEQYVKNVEIENRMIAASRPGVAEGVPVGIAFAAYREMGYAGEEKQHHQGGAMGYRPRDSTPGPESGEPIRENQALCWNPSISGTKSEDGFICSPAGPIFITRPIVFPTLTSETGGIKFVRPDMYTLD
ncbi:MAG: aminopeptidase P family N-terminal domain-containing protein [Planctomycetota bacterium]|jgi:Xaa-Pro aminopeptidase|nr:aminopeptidase P family N-terminal domain-containing protein [Planctomycetota bacterium]